MLPPPRLFAGRADDTLDGGELFQDSDSAVQGVDLRPECLGRATGAEGYPKVTDSNGAQVQQVGQFAGHVKLQVQGVKSFICLYCNGIGTISKPTSGKKRKKYPEASIVRHDGVKFAAACKKAGVQP
jgi:hypothetical protein